MLDAWCLMLGAWCLNTRQTHPQRVPQRRAAEGRASFVEAAEGRLPLWMGLTSFFKRVETRLFKRVQTSWFQRAFHGLLKNKLGSLFPKKKQLKLRQVTKARKMSQRTRGNLHFLYFPFLFDDFLPGWSFCPTCPIGALPDWHRIARSVWFFLIV